MQKYVFANENWKMYKFSHYDCVPKCDKVESLEKKFERANEAPLRPNLSMHKFPTQQYYPI